MTAIHRNCLHRTVWEPSMMAAGSSSVRLSMPRSAPASVFPGSADTHRTCMSRALRTAVCGGHESDRRCHVVRSDRCCWQVWRRRRRRRQRRGMNFRNWWWWGRLWMPLLPLKTLESRQK